MMNEFEIDEDLLPSTHLDIGKPLKAPNKILDFDAKGIPYGKLLYASTKIDGNRGMAIGNRLITSSGKNVRNESFQERFANVKEFCKKYGVVLDYEVFDESATHHAQISGPLNSYDQQIPNGFCLYVFDAAYHYHYTDQCRDTPFKDRIDLVKQCVDQLNDPRIKVLEQYQVKTREETEALFYKFIDAGWEGLMLRTGDIWYEGKYIRGGFYKHGRATLEQQIMWKFKRYLTLDGIVVGFLARKEMDKDAPREYDELGYLKPVRKLNFTHEIEEMGALRVKYENPDNPGSYLECNVSWGRGWDRLSRKELWKIRESLIGKYVEFKYMPHGAKKEGGVARHGRLVRLRPDKD